MVVEVAVSDGQPLRIGPRGEQNLAPSLRLLVVGSSRCLRGCVFGGLLCYLVVWLFVYLIDGLLD